MAEREVESGMSGSETVPADGQLSPLSGAYLLIVIGEPASPEHKELILQRISKGFLSWDLQATGCDLSAELQLVVDANPTSEEAKTGERLIQFATENLVTEVLINAQVNTLTQCVKNLLASYTRQKHVIHAGYAFSGSGSWVLQDGTFSYLDFIDALQEAEVQRLLRAYENCVSIHVHCAPEGQWNTSNLNKESCTKLAQVRINPTDKSSPLNGVSSFVDYLAQFLKPQPLGEILEPSDVVGNIRFSRPTLYIFPGGQGDSALFGVNGFNMLVDGGFSRRACFWDFIRHLDRVDALLVTRLNNSNVSGVRSLLKRKVMSDVYPQIGHVFCNVSDKKQSPDGLKDQDSLVIDVIEENHGIVENLKQLNVKPQACYRDPNIEPINLYHKVGHGKLDMYVVNPSRDSREVKEFLHQWNAQSHYKAGMKMNDRELTIPLPNLMSICALLVWQPADPKDSITRILFPGSSPQMKIFEGLEKLKHLEVLKHPVCTEKVLRVPSAVKTKRVHPSTEIRSTKYPIPRPVVSPKATEEKAEVKSSPSRADKRAETKAAEKKEEKKHEARIKSEEKKEERKPETKKTEEKREMRRAAGVSTTPKKPEVSKVYGVSKPSPKPEVSRPPTRAKGVKDATNKKAVEAKNIATKAATAAAARKEVLRKKPPGSPSRVKPAAKPLKKISPTSSVKSDEKEEKVPESPALSISSVPEEDKNKEIILNGHADDNDMQVAHDSAEEEKISVDEKQSLEEETRAEKEELMKMVTEELTQEEKPAEERDQEEHKVPETVTQEICSLVSKVAETFPSEEEVVRDLEQEFVQHKVEAPEATEPKPVDEKEEVKEIEKPPSEEIALEEKKMEDVKPEPVEEETLKPEPSIEKPRTPEIPEKPETPEVPEKTETPEPVKKTETPEPVKKAEEKEIEEKEPEEEKSPAPVKISSAVEAFGADIREALMKTREMMLGGIVVPPPSLADDKKVAESKPSEEVSKEITKEEPETKEETVEVKATEEEIQEKEVAVTEKEVDVVQKEAVTIEKELEKQVQEMPAEPSKSPEIPQVEPDVGKIPEEPPIESKLEEKLEKVEELKPKPSEEIILKEEVVEVLPSAEDELKEQKPSEQIKDKVEVEHKEQIEHKEEEHKELEEPEFEPEQRVDKDETRDISRERTPTPETEQEIKQEQKVDVHAEQEMIDEPKEKQKTEPELEHKEEPQVEMEHETKEDIQFEQKITDIPSAIDKIVSSVTEAVDKDLKSLTGELKSAFLPEKDKEVEESAVKEIDLKKEVESLQEDFKDIHKDIADFGQVLKEDIEAVKHEIQSFDSKIKDGVEDAIQAVETTIPSKSELETKVTEDEKLVKDIKDVKDVVEEIEKEKVEIEKEEKHEIEEKIEEIKSDVVKLPVDDKKILEVEKAVVDSQFVSPFLKEIPTQEAAKDVEKVTFKEEHVDKEPTLEQKPEKLLEREGSYSTAETIPVSEEVPTPKESLDDHEEKMEMIKSLPEEEQEEELEKHTLEKSEKKSQEESPVIITKPEEDLSPAPKIEQCEQKYVYHHEYPKTPDEVADLPIDEEIPPLDLSASPDTTQDDSFIQGENNVYDNDVAVHEIEAQERASDYVAHDTLLSQPTEPSHETKEIEEQAEDEKIDTSKVVKAPEQGATPVYTTLSADHAEVVTLSEGTSPSTPLSPKLSPEKSDKVCDEPEKLPPKESEISEPPTKKEKEDDKPKDDIPEKETAVSPVPEPAKETAKPETEEPKPSDISTKVDVKESKPLITESPLLDEDTKKTVMADKIAGIIKDEGDILIESVSKQETIEHSTRDEKAVDRIDTKSPADEKDLMTDVRIPSMVAVDSDEEDEEEEDMPVFVKSGTSVDPMTQSFYGEETVFSEDAGRSPPIGAQFERSPVGSPPKSGDEREEEDRKYPISGSMLGSDERKSDKFDDIHRVTSLSELESDSKVILGDVASTRRSFSDEYTLKRKPEDAMSQSFYEEQIKEENIYQTVDGTTQRMDQLGKDSDLDERKEFQIEEKIIEETSKEQKDISGDFDEKHELLGKSPTPSDKSPSHGEKSPTPSPGEKSPTPSRGEKSPTPSRGEKSPTPSPGEKSPTPSPGEKSPTPSPGEKSPTPSDKSPSHGEKSPTPSDKSPLHGEKSPTPSDKPSSEVEISPSHEIQSSDKARGLEEPLLKSNVSGPTDVRCIVTAASFEVETDMYTSTPKKPGSPSSDDDRDVADIELEEIETPLDSHETSSQGSGRHDDAPSPTRDDILSKDASPIPEKDVDGDTSIEKISTSEKITDEKQQPYLSSSPKVPSPEPQVSEQKSTTKDGETSALAYKEEKLNGETTLDDHQSLTKHGEKDEVQYRKVITSFYTEQREDGDGVVSKTTTSTTITTKPDTDELKIHDIDAKQLDNLLDKLEKSSTNGKIELHYEDDQHDSEEEFIARFKSSQSSSGGRNRRSIDSDDLLDVEEDKEHESLQKIRSEEFAVLGTSPGEQKSEHIEIRKHEKLSSSPQKMEDYMTMISSQRAAGYQYLCEETEKHSNGNATSEEDEGTASIKSGHSGREQLEGEFVVQLSPQKQSLLEEEGSDEEYRTESSPRIYDIDDKGRNGAKPVVAHGGGQAASWDEEMTAERPVRDWERGYSPERYSDEDECLAKERSFGSFAPPTQDREWSIDKKTNEFSEKPPMYGHGSESSGGSSPHGFEMDSPEIRPTGFDFSRPTLEDRYLPDLKRHDLTSSSASSTQLSTPSSESGIVKDDKHKTPIDDWGEPMGLPSPPPPPTSEDIEKPLQNGKPLEKKKGPRSSKFIEGKTMGSKIDNKRETARDERKPSSATASPKKTVPAKAPSRDARDLRQKRPESPKPVIDSKKQTPSKSFTSPKSGSASSHFYVDLTYVPHHGNPHYSNVEFFKRVRARYYVFSGINPSKEVLNSLLEAKQTWEDKDLEVTIIPTYDTDTLGYWVALNEDLLSKHKIDLAPSASRCTINLQDHETSCSAYRLEF